MENLRHYIGRRQDPLQIEDTKILFTNKFFKLMKTENEKSNKLMGGGGRIPYDLKSQSSLFK